MAFHHGHFGKSAAKQMPKPDISKRPGSEEAPGAKMPAGSEPHIEHSSKHGSQPHPSTGVHSVHIHHMGGGKHMSHVHHEGGHVETVHHTSAHEAHQHAQEMLPSEPGQHEEPAGDEGMDMSSIGGQDESEEA